MKKNKIMLFTLLVLIQFIGYSQKPFSKVKNLSLPFNAKISDVIPSNKNGFQLDKSSWVKYGFDVLQEYYEHESSDYKIFGQFVSKENKLLLIERKYSEENNHWLCILDKNNQIIDWLEIAYDNSEGFAAIKATTKEGKTHIIFINKGKTDTFKILGINDALKNTDYSWAGIFKKVNNGEVLWSNYEDDFIEFEDVPENKKVRLNYDALFVHAEESCGGGFIFWEDGQFNWLQQE